MTHDQFEVLSNQAVAGCAIVYFLAVLAHLWQWALLRHVTPTDATAGAAAPGAVLVGAGGADVATHAGMSDTAVADRAEDGGSGSAGVADLEGAGVQRAEMFGRIGVALTVVAVAIHLVAVVSRGLAADPARVPWGNMYEFTLTATCVVGLAYLLLYRKLSLGWLAPIVTSFILITLMVDVLLLYEPAVPLRDALDSPWLVIHVVGAIIATGAFTIGGMASALYLIKSRWPHTRPGGYLDRLPPLEVLDRVAYRVHAFGFPVWTFAALIAGPIWAQHAWGSYWNWDPKEVWAFITWVVYAAYLHARATAGWKGQAAAAVALIGLATLWFNFIGINFFFGSGSMHSYA